MYSNRFKTTIQHFRSKLGRPQKSVSVGTDFIRPKLKNINDDLVFERVTLEDGLPHATVLSIVQDRVGFMWFATHNGLARYDGYSFHTFQHHPDDPTTLPSNLIFALFQDHAQRMWVGTDGGGLSRFDPETETFHTYQHQPENP